MRVRNTWKELPIKVYIEPDLEKYWFLFETFNYISKRSLFLRISQDKLIATNNFLTLSLTKDLINDVVGNTKTYIDLSDKRVTTPIIMAQIIVSPKYLDYGLIQEYIIAHEIGHALGFSHSQDINSLMYPSITSEIYFNLGMDLTNRIESFMQSVCNAYATDSCGWGKSRSAPDNCFYA